ncbi:MAG: DNA polymerase III subunit delta' [Clostridia bacterium]|nr:DNA polymerase III subunit delta' [Clostridia bacterium]
MKLPLIGNERILRNVTSMIKNNRLSHAILLEGEKGLGKKTLAFYIAKAFLCREEEKPCLACKSCHLIEVGSHPDCMLISPDGAGIKVDQIRNLRNEAYLTPMMSEGRVFIIDLAETMNENSQNALLKVLEEPPTNVCFLLLCSNSNALLPTIRSRCVCMSLAPVPLEQEGADRVAELLKDTDKDAVMLLTAADGNIGKAVALADDNSIILSRLASDILMFAAENDRFSILISLQQFAKSREKVPSIIYELKNALGKEMQKKAVKEFSSFTNERLITCYENLKKIEATLDYNPSLALVFCRIADCLTTAF